MEVDRVDGEERPFAFNLERENTVWMIKGPKQVERE